MPLPPNEDRSPATGKFTAGLPAKRHAEISGKLDSLVSALAVRNSLKRLVRIQMAMHIFQIILLLAVVILLAMVAAGILPSHGPLLPG